MKKDLTKSSSADTTVFFLEFRLGVGRYCRRIGDASRCIRFIVSVTEMQDNSIQNRLAQILSNNPNQLISTTAKGRIVLQTCQACVHVNFARQIGFVVSSKMLFGLQRTFLLLTQTSSVIEFNDLVGVAKESVETLVPVGRKNKDYKVP